MTPLSEDPEKRRRQIANLRQGGPPNSGSWKAGGAGPHTKTGYRTRNPSPLELEPHVEKIVEALVHDLPFKYPDGSVPNAARPMVESAALDALILRRVLGYFGTNNFVDARGDLRSRELALLSQANERYARKLHALGLSLRSALELGVDLKTLTEGRRDLALEWARDQDDDHG
ncbi:MAG: hypothetical protein M3355_08590 [Actinomycetota bacterium]|nr:hypothetical protein [Actinomycetota bacterium]